MEYTIRITEQNGLTDLELLNLSQEISEALEGYSVEVSGVEADPLGVTFFAVDHAEAEDTLEFVQDRLTKDGWEGVRFGLDVPEE